MEYYSAVKRNGLLACAYKTQINLKTPHGAKEAAHRRAYSI
jgi:hypothetical protein